MSRVVSLDDNKYFFENGQWVDLLGNPADETLSQKLYNEYLHDVYNEHKQTATLLSFDELISTANEAYDEMDSIRERFNWRKSGREKEYYLRMIAAKPSAYYETAFLEICKNPEKYSLDVLNYVAFRLSSSLRVFQDVERWQALIMKLVTHTPKLVSVELLASAIGACTDFFVDSDYTDSIWLETGIDYFSKACNMTSGNPPLTVRRAGYRMYCRAAAHPEIFESVEIRDFVKYVSDFGVEKFFRLPQYQH